MSVCFQIYNFESLDQFGIEIDLNTDPQVAILGPNLALSTIDSWQTGEPAGQR